MRQHSITWMKRIVTFCWRCLVTRDHYELASTRPTHGRSIRSSLVTFLLVLSLIVPSSASNGKYRLCFNQVVGLPVLNPPQNDPCTGQPMVPLQSPHVDGCVKGDPGWTQAFRYVWGNGVDSGTMAPLPPNAAIQGIRDNTFLYLSIEVNNDTGFDNNDLIILTFSPSNGMSSSDDRRIHIYPNTTNMQKAVGSAPRLVQYWTDSSHWNNQACTGPNNPPGCDSLASPKALPAGVAISVSNAMIAGKASWFVEAKIPLADFDIPATGRFGFYVNIFRVITGGIANQYFWPSASAAGTSNNGVQLLVEQHTPTPTNWGEVTQDPALVSTCKGVSLAWNDITSNHPPDQIDATCLPGPGPNCATQTNSNTFSALLHNNSVGIDGSGNQIDISAQGVLATFSIANFGLPSSWTPIPVGTPAGRTGPVDINPNSTATLTTNPAWVITDPNLISNYKANPDQCILVELDSTAPSCVGNPNNCVAFVNRSVKRNMWVLTASEVSKTAEISAKGYGPPPAGRSKQEFLLHVSSQHEVLSPKSPVFTTMSARGQGGGGRVVSRLTWATDGCRLTGEYATINGTKYELCDDVGAFGAVVEHFGTAPVEKWVARLEGVGLDRDREDDNTYRLLVPEDDVAKVTVNFQPEEGKGPSSKHVPIALFLDFGGNFPQGNFGQVFNKGFSFNAGLEYAPVNNLAIEGIFGYHHFPVKSIAGGVLSDLNVYHFSANAKFYALNGTVGGHPARLFFNFGPGGYKFSSADTYFGGNVGAGVLFEPWQHLGLQFSYNFHAVKTPVTTEFSTAQAGLRFVF